MFSFLRKWWVPKPSEPEPPAGEPDAAMVDTAHFIRGCRRRRRLPLTRSEDEVECGIVNRMRRRIERAVRGFIEFVRPGVIGLTGAGDVSWVSVTKEFWLLSIEVLVRRWVQRLRGLKGDIEDIEVSQALIEMSKRILIPMTHAVRRIRRRLKAYLGTMVGLEALANGVTLRAVGVEGGLLTTWPIAFGTGLAIVLLGAACGGFLWPRLKRPGIAVWGRWIIVIGTAVPAAVALYIAIAMGIVRSTGSFEFDAIIKIIIAPSPKDIGSIALTILNCAFFISAFWLTYRAKRDVDETYETVVAVRGELEENREEDVEKAQNLLMAIPMAAAAAFAALRQDRRAELAAALRAARGMDAAWNAVTELADREIDAAETAISRHREAVIRIWRPEWGCDVTAFYYERPDLRTVIAPVLDDAEAKVKLIRDQLAHCTEADAKVDTAITFALAEIQAAVRAAIVRLDEAAYGMSATAPKAPAPPPTSVPPARNSLKLVPPAAKGEDDATQPAE